LAKKKNLKNHIRDFFSMILFPLKWPLRNILTFALNPTVRAIRSSLLLDEIGRQAIESSAKYVLERMNSVVLFQNPQDLWRHAFAQEQITGLYLEFGVYQGNSINYFANLLNEKAINDDRLQDCLIHGFDSFEGLQEDWVGSNGMLRGHFNLHGRMPKVEGRVRLYKGFFSQSLPDFLLRQVGPIAFVHFDADTYESTKYVLETIRERLRPGSILIFDEYIGYTGWKSGEFRAWQEFVKSNNVTYTYLALSTAAVSLRVDEFRF
jgi:hypothetical protein